MPSEKRNVFLLAACMALGMSCTSLVMTSAAVVGSLLAPWPMLATLPLALMFVGMMTATLPASLLMQRMGRGPGFAAGAAIGIAGGLLAFAAVLQGGFWLLSAGMFLLGAASAFTQHYRFAAADVASEAFRPKAISWVMAGGIVSAFLGPNLAQWGKDAFPWAEFAGTFLALPLLQGGILLLLPFARLPRPAAREDRGDARPLTRIAQQPAFLVAVLGAVVGYAGMNFVMITTPLAMLEHAHSFADAALVLQWHVLGMFVPSFFTGSLIKRFGAPRVMLAGTGLYALCVALNLGGGGHLMHSYLPALILLGTGWNFLFVGGTALLTETHSPAEKGKVQGFNDFLVFTAVALSALTSGGLHAAAGWAVVNLVLLVLAAGAAVALVWYGRARRAGLATPAR